MVVFAGGLGCLLVRSKESLLTVIEIESTLFQCEYMWYVGF